MNSVKHTPDETGAGLSPTEAHRLLRMTYIIDKSAGPTLLWRFTHPRWQQVIVAAGLIVIWQVASSAGILPSTGVPSPGSTFQRWAELLFTPIFWQAVISTLLSWFVGMVASVLLAVPLGVAIGLSPFFTMSTRFSIDFMRTVPPVALFPVLLLWLGPTMEMKVALAVVGTVWPLLIQAIYASGQIDPVLKDTVRSFRLSRRTRLRFLLIPSVTPFIATGMRIAATVSLLLNVTAEYLGGASGIGRELNLAEQIGNLPEMYAYILSAATLGVLINVGFISLQRRILWWHPSLRTAAKR